MLAHCTRKCEPMQQRSRRTPWVFAAGMHLARNKADPQYRTRGAVGGRQMVAFTSEQAHYSYLKAAFTTGAAVTSCAEPLGGADAAAPVWLALLTLFQGGRLCSCLPW